MYKIAVNTISLLLVMHFADNIQAQQTPVYTIDCFNSIKVDSSQYTYPDGSYVIKGIVWKARFSQPLASSYFNYLRSHHSGSSYGIPPLDYSKLIKARSMMYW